jgi:hypothetical protein
LAGGIHIWGLAFVTIVMTLVMAFGGYGLIGIFVTWILMQAGYLCWLVLLRRCDDGND